MEFKTPLCEIAFKYRTDKCPQIRHSYTPVYYELLKDKINSIKKVLEIGVGTAFSMRHVPDYIVGASHKMWKDFFPNAQIYGIDIDLTDFLPEERIEMFLMDSTNEQNINTLIQKIGSDQDLVVDDGPHAAISQLNLAKVLVPLLTGDFIYIIEDCKRPDFLKENLNFSEYNVEVIKLNENPKVADDNLVIIRPK
jgi:hypothetical protein